jgi:UDP-glucose 4-epimerase
MREAEKLMRILMTGAKGYIGRYSVQLFLAAGHTVIDYHRSQRVPFKTPQLIAVYGECYDVAHMVHVFQDHKVDAVVHLAGQSSPWVSLEVPYQTMEANVMSSIAILEAARICGIKRVVFYSSECAYGEHPDEACGLNTALVPRTVYGVTKATVEMLARVYNWQYGMSCVSIRCARVYGGKQLTPNTVTDMITAAVQGKKFTAATGADTYANLIHADDIADITYKATVMNPSRVNDMAVYNAVSQGVFLKDVLKIIAELVPGFQYEMGAGREVVNGVTNEQQGQWDMSATERDLDFHVKYTLREGLEAYYHFIKEELKV